MEALIGLASFALGVLLFVPALADVLKTQRGKRRRP
jgi:hypothetical protein